MSLIEYARHKLEMQLPPLQVAASSGGENDARRRTRREQLVRVVNALRAIDEESWGVCRQCGVPIELDRLLKLPETDRCRGCSGAVTARSAWAP